MLRLCNIDRIFSLNFSHSDEKLDRMYVRQVQIVLKIQPSRDCSRDCSNIQRPVWSDVGIKVANFLQTLSKVLVKKVTFLPNTPKSCQIYYVTLEFLEIFNLVARSDWDFKWHLDAELRPPNYFVLKWPFEQKILAIFGKNVG